MAPSMQSAVVLRVKEGKIVRLEHCQEFVMSDLIVAAMRKAIANAEKRAAGGYALRTQEKAYLFDEATYSFLSA